MKAELIPIYREILEKYRDGWFTAYDICGAEIIEENDKLKWTFDSTERGYYMEILDILHSAGILRRAKKHKKISEKLRCEIYVFYKLKKEVDIKIIESMDFLHKEGYFSKNDINTIKIIKADNGEFSEINKRLNRLEESMKVLQQEIRILSQD